MKKKFNLELQRTRRAKKPRKVKPIGDFQDYLKEFCPLVGPSLDDYRDFNLKSLLWLIAGPAAPKFNGINQIEGFIKQNLPEAQRRRSLRLLQIMWRSYKHCLHDGKASSEARQPVIDELMRAS